MSMRSARLRYWRDPDNQVVVLAFMECNSTPNYVNSLWSTVAQFGPDNNHQAHGGFLHEYLGLRHAIVRFLEACREEFSGPDWLLLLTGWSLGGALCTLCAVDIFDTHFDQIQQPHCPVALVSFGSPRVLNFELATWLDEQSLFQSLRVQAEGDFFCCNPAQLWGRFWHCGRRGVVRHNAENGSWDIVEHAEQLGEEDESLLRKVTLAPTLPLRLLDGLAPSISSSLGGLFGIFVDVPVNLPNFFVHFYSYQNAFCPDADFESLLPHRLYDD